MVILAGKWVNPNAICRLSSFMAIQIYCFYLGTLSLWLVVKTCVIVYCLPTVQTKRSMLLKVQEETDVIYPKRTWTRQARETDADIVTHQMW